MRSDHRKELGEACGEIAGGMEKIAAIVKAWEEDEGADGELDNWAVDYIRLRDAMNTAHYAHQKIATIAL